MAEVTFTPEEIATFPQGPPGPEGDPGPPGPSGGLGNGLHVRDFGAVGDSVTDDYAAIQAALNACDPNRGGDVYFSALRYRISQGLVVPYQGTRLIGEGMPGTRRSQAQGSTRIIVDNGITAISCNPSATPHLTLGFGFENLHVLPKTGSTTGNGILIRNAERTMMRNVTCSDFIAGYGLRIDGGGGNAQYAILDNYSGGDCMTGLHLTGPGPHGCILNGGYFNGAGQTPRPGSVGIWQETGDTLKVYGTVIQGYATGFYSSSGASVCADLFGMRLEYCNIGWRIASDRVQVYGGTLVNSILTGSGTSSIGVQVDATANKTYLRPSLISTFSLVSGATPVQAIIDNGTGTINEYVV